ncbi:MAG: methyltransferase domain-containing protein [Patescibacteria group bacterium]
MIGSIEQTPLESNSIDIVISEFVLEHLQNPTVALKEIFRVLKPNGVLIFITPNVVNPVMILSNILPYKWHKLLRQALLKKQAEPHPTYYKANTYRNLLKLGKNSGFNERCILRAGNPEYLGFCKPLVLPAILFEKIIDNHFLDILKMYLLGCFIKK